MLAPREEEVLKRCDQREQRRHLRRDQLCLQQDLPEVKLSIWVDEAAWVEEALVAPDIPATLLKALPPFPLPPFPMPADAKNCTSLLELSAEN